MIQRGQTSIYIFDKDHKTCADKIRNEITKHKIVNERKNSEEVAEPLPASSGDCSFVNNKNFKRSATNEQEEEIIVVVKKRGNKVFIEI